MPSVEISRPRPFRRLWLFATSGVVALAACGLTLEAGDTAEPGAEAGSPPSASSSGLGGSSSSSSSSSNGQLDGDAPIADATPDALPTDVCTSFDLSTFVCPTGASPPYGCTGDTVPFPAPEADAGPPRGFRLNSGASSEGGLWVRTTLKKSHAFTAVALLVAAPDEGSGVNVGMGATLALITADSTGDPPFPALGGIGPRLSLAKLGGGTGVAAYWRDLHDTDYDVGHYRFGVTRVPAEVADEVDGWESSAPTSPLFTANGGSRTTREWSRRSNEGSATTSSPRSEPSPTWPCPRWCTSSASPQQVVPARLARAIASVRSASTARRPDRDTRKLRCRSSMSSGALGAL